jgi:hypothetical protein
MLKHVICLDVGVQRNHLRGLYVVYDCIADFALKDDQYP